MCQDKKNFNDTCNVTVEDNQCRPKKTILMWYLATGSIFCVVCPKNCANNTCILALFCFFLL